MGKSAKLHKRVKKVKSTGGGGSTSTPVASAAQGQVQTAKKRATLKGRTSKTTPGANASLLGGADYVDLMMGGRRKAKEESQKLISGSNTT
ncbi:hypothetical protein H0H93_014614 [Arthromyces matolae]|nr:hypothetical protein H0H93_014614 [Arthromyces matolae]